MATIIIKITENCNSRCIYCDVVRKERTGKTMSLVVLENLFRKADEYLQANPEEDLQFLWHGGEPLLPGIKYYEKLLRLQEKHCSSTKNRIIHSIQTNLTLFNEDFVEIFYRMGIGAVGTSYDPELNVRGIGGVVDTLGYNQKFLKAIQHLEKNKIGWGIIYVVTKKSLENPMKVFYFLTNLLLTGGINFNPVLIYDKERKNISITPEEYIDFLGAIFPEWWKNRNLYPDIEPFRSLTKNIIEGQRHLGCVDSGDCTYHHINIAPNGDASQCGRSSDWNLLDYGNILDNSIDQILYHKEREVLEDRVRLLKEGECAGCRFWELCHGGCPLDAWSKHNSFLHKSEWCYAKKGFIEKYFEPVTGTKFQPMNA